MSIIESKSQLIEHFVEGIKNFDVRDKGFEPLTFRSEDGRSIQLKLIPHTKFI